MGTACCQQPYKQTSQQQDPIPVEVKVLESQCGPFYDQDLEFVLDTRTQKLLSSKNPFRIEMEKLKDTFKTKKYPNGNKYVGQIDMLERPHGLGKLIREDNSILIGHFKEGMVNGSFCFANQDGVVCQGQVVNGFVECKEGNLQTPKCKYYGGFSKNLFHGKGVFITKKSKFEGAYEQGKKKQGKISWTDGEYAYLYEGSFDKDEKFTGKGRLIEPFGQYDGQFFQGLKHGVGKYTFSSQLVYEGEYKHGERQGKGKLINKDGSLSYQGIFSKGFPNGKGKSYSNGKVLQEGKFVDGICEQSL